MCAQTWSKLNAIMLEKSPASAPQLGFFDIFDQVDRNDPLLQLGNAIPWEALEKALSPLYSDKGRKAKPIRLMCGLLILKQLDNLSDEAVVRQWKRNPYYQLFCGETSFQSQEPCHSTELVKFRNRLGKQGIENVFAMSVALHGDAAEEDTVLVDTTVQEKAVTYPTDTKLAIKIINRLNKLAKENGIKQRRTFVKEVKELRLKCRHFRSKKFSRKARRALKRLRTIAGILLRELQRKLPEAILEQEKERFELYLKALSQSRKDKDKIYSLHESDIYCVGKGKEHKPYEYGRKASVVATLDSKVIVGVVSHDEHVHDSKTLKPALDASDTNRRARIKTAVVDRGYRGCKRTVKAEVIIPSNPLKTDSEYERSRKRELCQRRSAIEPIIGHLKQDYRLTQNWLKGSEGDAINLMMAACAWNLRKWMAIFFCYEKEGIIFKCMLFIDGESQAIILAWAK